MWNVGRFILIVNQFIVMIMCNYVQIVKNKSTACWFGNVFFEFSMFRYHNTLIFFIIPFTIALRVMWSSHVITSENDLSSGD